MSSEPIQLSWAKRESRVAPGFSRVQLRSIKGSYTVSGSGADCKSVVFGLGWFDSITSHQRLVGFAHFERLYKRQKMGLHSEGNWALYLWIQYLIRYNLIVYWKTRRRLYLPWVLNGSIDKRLKSPPFHGGSVGSNPAGVISQIRVITLNDTGNGTCKACASCPIEVAG